MGHPSRMNEGNDERGSFRERDYVPDIGGKSKFAYRVFHSRGIAQGGKKSLSVADHRKVIIWHCECVRANSDFMTLNA